MTTRRAWSPFGRSTIRDSGGSGHLLALRPGATLGTDARRMEGHDGGTVLDTDRVGLSWWEDGRSGRVRPVAAARQP